MRCRDGLPNKDVAQRLGITLSTAKNHWTVVMRTFEAPSVAKACFLVGQAYAVRAMRPDEV